MARPDTIGPRPLSAALLSLLAVLAGCTTASVSSGAVCAAPPPLNTVIKQASLVFVGRVTTTEGYVSNVRVQQVWRGDVPAQVRVQGGPADPPTGVHGEGWHSFKVGQRYLFFPSRQEQGAPLYDHGCSSTRPYTDDMASLAPPDVHPPSGPSGKPD